MCYCKMLLDKFYFPRINFLTKAIIHVKIITYNENDKTIY